MFDGDHNVLLRDLQEITTIPDLTDAMHLSILKHGGRMLEANKTRFGEFDIYSSVEVLEKAISGFEYGEEKWYPQIYIPFYEEVSLYSVPTIAVGHEDGGDCIVLAYRPTKNGQYEPFEITEDYARNNLTWVISTNESVDNEGNIANYDYIYSNSNKRSFNPDATFVSSNKIKISTKKECWLCGKADVWFLFSNIFTLPLSSPNDCDHRGSSQTEVLKVRKKDLNKFLGATKSLMYSHGATSHELDSDETILLAMFEKDNGNQLQEVIFEPCYHSYYVRSNDDIYGHWGVGEMDYSDFENPLPFVLGQPAQWKTTQVSNNNGKEVVEMRYRQGNNF